MSILERVVPVRAAAPERRRRWPSWVGIVVLGVVAYLAVTNLQGDQGLVAVLVVIWAIALVGLNVVQGLGGYPSLAQAGFFGIGAYASSLLLNAGLPFVVAALGAVGIASVVGAIVALVFSRTRGQYFAIGTLFFGAVCALVFINEAPLTGGPNGMPVALGLPLEVVLVLIVGSLVVGLILFELLGRSVLGERLRAISADEDLAEHAGVPTARTKAIAFVISSLFGAWAGVLLAQYNGVIAPSQFTFVQGFLMFVAIGIGGYGRLSTPVVGAVIVVGLSQLLKLYPGVSQIALGVIFVLVTLLMPGGIIGGIEQLLGALRRAFGGRAAARNGRVATWKEIS
ncbi:branched-chain amino acid ABC transporter permease [Microbacterium sp. 22303]|uniref:branched-chain amino acid ABC transporter permease n=1 Tax=Microbacterium sp. 22303 TaxID=3453905 RepID=UPI003F85C9D9